MPEQQRDQLKASSREVSRRSHVLTVVAGIAIAIILGSSGAVEPMPRAALALCGLVGMWLVLWRARDRGVAWWTPEGWSLWAIGFLALLPGLVPVPPSVSSLVSPGMQEAFPSADLHTLGYRWPGVVEGLTLWFLAGLFFVVGLQVRQELGHRGTRRFLAGFAVAWVGVAWLHQLLGWNTLFGVWEFRSTPNASLWGTMVNPNHFAFVCLLLWPSLVRALRKSDEHVGLRLLFGLTASSILALAWLSRSASLFAGLCAWGAYMALRNGRWKTLRPWNIGVLVAFLGAGVALWLQFVERTWWTNSAKGRALQYLDTLQLIADHWMFGVGAGGYQDAYPPFRSFPSSATFHHAHSDLLEVLAEVGLWGAACGAVGLWLLARHRRAMETPRGVRRTNLLRQAFVGAGAICLVDFPLHLPGLVVLAALLAGLIWRPGTRPVPGMSSRRLVPAGVMSVVAIACVGFLYVRGAEAGLVERVEQGDDPLQAAAELRRIAPWNELGWMAIADSPEGQAALVRFEDSGHVLRFQASSAARQGRMERAAQLLERSEQRDPWDLRTPLMRARWAREAGEVMQAAEFGADMLRRGAPFDQVPVSTMDELYGWLPVTGWWLERMRNVSPRWLGALARLALKESDPYTALEACNIAERSDYLNAARCMPKARALEMLGRHDQAVALAERWVRDEPRCASCYVELARLQWDHGDAGRGWSSLGRSMAIRPMPMVADMVKRAARSCERFDAPTCPKELLRHPSVLDEIRQAQRAVSRARDGEAGACVSAVQGLWDGGMDASGAADLCARWSDDVASR